MRDIELEGVTNVRDLGGIPVGYGRMVSPGLFFRGGSLDKATENDCDVLFGELGITRIIDVRCGWELEQKPDVAVEGVENLHIPFFDQEKVGIEYTTFVEGTKPDGHDVACDPDHFYRTLPNPLTAGQMCEGLNRLFETAMQGHAVYFHCSGGKDRAGMLALLALHVLGASREDILADYLHTNVARDKNFDAMYARFLRLAQGDDKRARELVESHRARPENLEAFFESIDERYGSFDAFMRAKLDMGPARVARIRELCTVPCGEDVRL